MIETIAKFAEMKNKFNENIEKEIADLRAKQELMAQTYTIGESIMNAFPKLYKKLHLTGVDNLNVRLNALSITFSCDSQFKPYLFNGYTKSGSSKNRNKCLAKAEKYSLAIEQMIQDTLGLKVDVMVNPYCFEKENPNKPDFLLVEIGLKKN